MTVIAAKKHCDKIEISCDSMMSRGWHKKSTGYPEKLVRGIDFVAGISGDASVIVLLSMYAKNHPIGIGGTERIIEWCSEFIDFVDKKTSVWGGECSIIIAHRSGLFMIQEWIPIEVSDWCAIGSGMQHAEAALFLGHNTKDAVTVAINLASGCGGDIITMLVETASYIDCDAIVSC